MNDFISVMLGVLTSIVIVYFIKQKDKIKELEEQKAILECKLDVTEKALNVEKETFKDNIDSLKKENEYLKLYVEKLKAELPEERAKNAEELMRDERIRQLKQELAQLSLNQNRITPYMQPPFYNPYDMCNAYRFRTW